jgi:hypothetical protein
MAQQTAVEWLMENIQKVHKMDWDMVFIQAKAMEKKQIIMAHGTKSNGRLKNDGQFIISEINGEQYYNETYNK